MIVRCTKREKRDGGTYRDLVVGKTYVVMTIHFSQRGSSYLVYIPEKSETPIPYDALCFSIVDGEIPEGWVFGEQAPGYYSIGPRAWMRTGFWECVFDGPCDARRVFERERDALVEKYLERTESDR